MEQSGVQEPIPLLVKRVMTARKKEYLPSFIQMEILNPFVTIKTIKGVENIGNSMKMGKTSSFVVM